MPLVSLSLWIPAWPDRLWPHPCHSGHLPEDHLATASSIFCDCCLFGELPQNKNHRVCRGHWSGLFLDSASSGARRPEPRAHPMVSLLISISTQH